MSDLRTQGLVRITVHLAEDSLLPTEDRFQRVKKRKKGTLSAEGKQKTVIWKCHRNKDAFLKQRRSECT